MRVGGSRRNLGVGVRSDQTLFGERRIVVAVNEVVGCPGMMRLFLENRFEDCAAFTLIGERFVGFWRRYA